MSFTVACIMCQCTGTLDIRYFYNEKQNTYEMEYHCSTIEGGCDFYRILPLHLPHDQVFQ